MRNHSRNIRRSSCRMIKVKQILHLWCSFSIESSRPDTAEKTAQWPPKDPVSWKHLISQVSQKNKKEMKIPEMAGVRTPSPITMQVPIKARTSKNLCNTLCFSSADFNLDPKFVVSVDPAPSFLYSESSSSADWQLGNELTRACRQSNE